MESTLSGLVLNPSKFSRLSLEEKRQLVHEISQCSEDAPRILTSLTRRELLEIICAEMGEERKYPGYTKFKMIDHLLNLVSSKSSVNTGFAFKRQRKQENQSQIIIQNDETHVLFCHNLACKAALERVDAFCKRCSCCICHQYDDNKDPSLWLTCDSDSPDEVKPCGLSCHLTCALKHEQSGISKNGVKQKLDGDFYCVSCGKVNGLMRTLRKQLMTAKEARRVDVFCLRISLSHKILEKTEKYKGLLKFVESAVDMLKNEVGPLAQASEMMDRRIVNRLSCGAQVQKLCAYSVEAFDSMFPNQCSNHMKKYEPPTIETTYLHNTLMHAESMSSTDNRLTSNDRKPCSMNDIESKDNAFPSKMTVPLASVVSSAPATPCQTDGSKEQVKESDYEYSVRVIRKLEHEGLMETDFRVKFLTWFSLKATTQERRVVRVFIDTFINDHSSLAGQLMDTFAGEIWREQKIVQHVLCRRFWH